MADLRKLFPLLEESSCHMQRGSDDWKPDALKGKSGYENHSVQGISWSSDMLHPSPAGVGHTAEMREMLAAQRDPAMPTRFYRLFDQWHREGRCPHPFLLSGCPRS